MAAVVTAAFLLRRIHRWWSGKTLLDSPLKTVVVVDLVAVPAMLLIMSTTVDRCAQVPQRAARQRVSGVLCHSGRDKREAARRHPAQRWRFIGRQPLQVLSDGYVRVLRRSSAPR